MLFNKAKRKTVYIMRHGKSSWEDFSVDDHNRVLLEEGIKKTNKVANYLKSMNVKPNLILSSTAVRALETSKLVASKLGYTEEEIKTSKKIYHAVAEDIFDELYGLDNSIDSVMIFGHNPTFTDFINLFNKPEIYNLPTSGVAAISFKTDKWEEIANSNFKVEFVVTPKIL